MLEDSFYMRLFSSDCHDVYDNTLSSFTVDMEHPLEFGENLYEVGIKSLILPPTSESMRRLFVDGIFMPSDKSIEFTSIQEFVSHLMTYVSNPGHYTPYYFAPFLDKGIVYDNYLLASRFASDYEKIPSGENLNTITLSFKLDQLFGVDEAKRFVNPKHFARASRTEMNVKVFKIKLPIPHLYPYSFRTILVAIIKKILFLFRGTDDYALYHRSFLSNLAVYDEYMEMMQHLHKHKANSNEVIHKFIEAFADAVEFYLNTHDYVEKVQYNRHIMLYTDLIQPTFVSGVRTRLMHMLFIENPASDMFVQVSYDSPMYFVVEKKSIESITFQLRGIQGDYIDFLPSHHATHLTLHFRRIVEGGVGGGSKISL